MRITRLIKNFSSQPGAFNRSEHLKQLHAQGRYLGTSKIGNWNKSEEKRERMKNIRSTNSLNKSSTGYGSEYHMRVANRTLLGNSLQGQTGYLYFLRFPRSIKIGFSKDWERRVTKQILGGEVIAIISGPTRELADLEFDIFQEFKEYTQLSPDKTRYTEFLDLSVRKKVYEFLKNRVNTNSNLVFEISNNLK